MLYWGSQHLHWDHNSSIGGHNTSIGGHYSVRVTTLLGVTALLGITTPPLGVATPLLVITALFGVTTLEVPIQLSSEDTEQSSQHHRDQDAEKCSHQQAFSSPFYFGQSLVNEMVPTCWREIIPPWSAFSENVLWAHPEQNFTNSLGNAQHPSS